MNEINPAGLDPDGPGDLFYPFNGLRTLTIAGELRITRELRDAIATTLEDSTLTDDGGKARTAVGALLWAVGELESELAALRKDRANGD
jgi:hypothetical protein